MNKDNTTSTDVMIIGGGLAGLTMAVALGTHGITTTIIERQNPEHYRKQAFDGRVSAIAHASKQLLRAIGVWEKMEPQAGPINDIRIVDQDSPLWLHYDHRDVGPDAMGYILENRHIRGALLDRIAALETVVLLAPETITELDIERAQLSTESGRELSAGLVIVADGKRSATRDILGIKPITWDYKQTAIVCTVEHEQPHDGLAVERFLPSGPFAILPMQNPHHSSLVWTEKRDEAAHYSDANDQAFISAIEERFGNFLGGLSLVGERFSYPLTLSFTTRYYQERAVLIGDAAHGIHPIAGQGFNLSMRDIATLTELVVEHKRLGLDVGSAQLLQTYERKRKRDNYSMIAVTDVLNRLFSNNAMPLALSRRLGLRAVENLPDVKQFFMKHAMGKYDTATLLQGELV